MLEILTDSEATGLLTLSSALAASFAAYFSWRQLRNQKRRWNVEDARKSPQIYVGLSNQHSNEGWFHGVWQVTNRANYELELFRIEAASPRTLMIGTLDPTTDGPVETMRAVKSGKALELAELIRVPRPPREGGLVSRNFLYKMSKKPDNDRGRTILLRFHIREVDNHSISYVKEGLAVVPRTKDV